MSRALDAVGVTRLADAVHHSTACTLWGIASYVGALVLSVTAVSQLFPPGVAAALNTACLAVTFVLVGLPQAVESVCLAAAGIIDTHVLMALAAFGTLYLGMAQEGALLLLLFQLSHTLEEKFTAKAQGSLQRLFANLPDKATRVDLDQSGAPQLASARSVLVRSVALGQALLVKAGEEVPLDGKITWGTANLSLQHISGESVPVRLGPGGEVPAGSLNLDGLLVVSASAGVDDSTPARIARMAAAAQANKPRLARQLAVVSEVWSKAVIGATLATLAGLLVAGVPLLGPGGALYRAMGVLTAGSPCAVVLVPLAYVCAVATVTRKGLLLKSAAALDNLASCTTVALDKTGTITTGALSLTAASVWPLTATSAPHVTPLTLVNAPSAAAAASMSDSLLSVDESGAATVGNEEARGAAEAAEAEARAFGASAIDYAIALSRASNHPVSQAMARYGAVVSGVQETTVANNGQHRWSGHTSATPQSVSENGHHNGPPRAPSPGRDVTVSDFQQVPGMGVQGVCSTAGAEGLGAMRVYFGSLDYVRSALPAGPLQDQLQRVVDSHVAASGARAVSYLLAQPLTSDPPSADTTIRPNNSTSSTSSTTPQLWMGLFGFEDQVAPGARQAVRALQKGQWRRPGSKEQHAADRKAVVMLTGDNERVAVQVANAVGISQWQAGMRPEHKLAYVEAHEQGAADGAGPGLVMVGDGINDAPALAAARVGVAVATTPSDLVAAAADVIILNGQGVSNLPWLYAVSHKTQVVVRQNLILALSAVACATLPTVAGVFPLWLAVLLHEGSTLLVALNSLRLLLDPGTRTLPAALASAGEAIQDLFAQATSAQQPHADHHHHHHHHHEHEHEHGSRNAHAGAHDGHHGHNHNHHHHHNHDDNQHEHNQHEHDHQPHTHVLAHRDTPQHVGEPGSSPAHVHADVDAHGRGEVVQREGAGAAAVPPQGVPGPRSAPPPPAPPTHPVVVAATAHHPHD